MSDNTQTPKEMSQRIADLEQVILHMAEGDLEDAVWDEADDAYLITIYVESVLKRANLEHHFDRLVEKVEKIHGRKVPLNKHSGN